MEDVDHTRGVLDRLKVLGVRVAIDDFGTGYSSFSYLRLLPVDTLKVDRSFVSYLEAADHDRPLECGRRPGSADDVALVDGIIQLAHTLRMEVVAEGVESRHQANLLHAQGCDYAQGFHFARPMPADAMREWLNPSSP